MPKPAPDPSDLQGANRLAIDAIVKITHIAEAVHLNILSKAADAGLPLQRPLSGATAFVYRSVRGISRMVGSGIGTLLNRLLPLLGKGSTWPGREPVLAALNGVMGDYLAASGNPLAMSMQLRRDGIALVPDRTALAAAIPDCSGRILLLVHGLCMNDLQWRRNGHDHGAALAAARGYTPIHVRYNSGLHVSTNGRELAGQLEQLIAQWPVPVQELVILSHSMGGLVTRSACHVAEQTGQAWRAHLKKIVFLGTPHHGAPLERGGNWFHVIMNASSYTAPFSDLGKLRSAGITDLRHGSLLDEDWEGKDRFARDQDARRPLPLPDGVQCYAIAAAVGSESPGLRRLLGDGLVQVPSALGQHENPEMDLKLPAENQWLATGMNHMDLLSRKEVCEQLLKWL